MKKLPTLTILAVAASACIAMAQTSKLQYPEARKTDHTDDYKGVTVADPYRWLEDPDSEETKKWVQEENALTASYIGAIPGRNRIEDRIKKLWNFERYGIPFTRGGRYFFTRNDGLQNQAPLYVAESLKGNQRVLIDPNKLSTDGTVALGETVVSDDGKLVVYSTEAAGSDWQTWRVRNVDTGKDTADVIHWSKFSGASWSKDNKGFYYSRYDEPKGNALREANYFHKLYYHRLGTPQSDDKLVYQRKDKKEWGFDGNVSDDGRYLIINVWLGSARENRIFYKDLHEKNAKVVELLPAGDAQYNFLGNQGTKMWFSTDKNAPKSRIISIDVRHPESEHWRTVVREAPEALSSASLVGDRFFCSYLKDAHGSVKMFDLTGKPLGEVALPGLGTVGGFAGRKSDKETFFSFMSYTSPTTIYRYEVPTSKVSVFRRPKVDFDASKFETKEVFFSSKDGTKVPMFLTYKKGIKLDGSNPTLMYGYGGFSSNETPAFSVSNLVFMEMGGIFADVVLRGGSEYGEAWHKAGMREKKQNVFDDFISGAEWLISKGYTSTPKLACAGGSNGGLLVGAVLTQRPDLWGATLPGVGVMDMLRFNKFTIGWAWVPEYGNPDDANDFKFIYKYSPLHNLKPANYPPTLITTADHDDRVVSGHSFKFAATMQAAQQGDAPVLIRVETNAGHGGGKPISKIIAERADMWAFLSKSLHFNVPESFGN